MRLYFSTEAAVLAIIASLALGACAPKGGSKGSDAPADPATPAGEVAIDTGTDGETEVTGGLEAGDDGSLTDPELLPPSMNQQIAVRPAISIGTVAASLNLTAPTELDLFTEGRYVWTPANMPLDELNKIVCVLARTGFHIYKDKGKFVAQVPMKECFKPMPGGDGPPGERKIEAPTDVIVETAASGGDIAIKIWFSRAIDMRNGMTPAMAEVFIGGHFETLALDYFVEATVKEIPTNESPFGVFDMKWEMLLKKDGVRDPKPFQQGYVTTTKTDDQIELRYNQRNSSYNDQACDSRATATYYGIPFVSTQAGAFGNNVTVTFDNAASVQTLVVDTAKGMIDPIGQYQIVIPTGDTWELSGGSGVANASVRHNGIELYALAPSAAPNGRTLAVDGVKTIQEVIDAYNEQYAPDSLSMSLFPNEMVLPMGTMTFLGGVTEVKANASVVLSTMPVLEQFLIEANPPSADMNGFRICFDGVKTVMQTLANIVLPGTNTLNVPIGGGLIPPQGMCVELAHGAGPLKDTWASIREFAAAARMTLVDGRPVRGKAHTAENWTQQALTSVCPNRVPAWNPHPVSYGLVFDRNDQPSDGAYPGRSVAKQYNDYVASGAAMGFDPAAPRCEQMGGELPNVWNYALFDDDGKKVNHKTQQTLYIEGSPNSWGDGSVSPWGTYIWSATTPSRVYIRNDDDTKRFFDVVTFDGVLQNDFGESQVFSQASGTERFECIDFCPAGSIDQDQMDHRWDSFYFLYNQDYVYDFATKRLYRDYDKDGGMDEQVVIGSGVNGNYDFRMTLKSDDDKSFRYSLSTYSPAIGLQEGGLFYTPPKRLDFDRTMTYDPMSHAYPGTETLNAAHDGQAFSTLASWQLSYDYGHLCCLDWEPKAGFIDQWGTPAMASKVTLKKGAPLRLDPAIGDPDGAGPLTAGMTLYVAPAFAELRPVSKNDCSTGILTQVANVPTDLPLPQPIADASVRQVGARIGDRPADGLPVLILNGEPL